MGGCGGVGAHSFPLLFSLFVLLVGVWEVEGKVRGDIEVVYVDGGGMVWNYTFEGNVLPVVTEYVWLYVCKDKEDYSCSPRTDCRTNVLDPQEPSSGRYGVYWDQPTVGESIQVSYPDGTQKELSEMSYLKSSSGLEMDDVQFLLGPGCQYPPTPPPPSNPNWAWWKILIVLVGCLLVVALIGTVVYLVKGMDKSEQTHELIN